MAKKDYDWENGATLDDHSKKKHAILSQYFEQYLRIRTQHRQMQRFRLSVVDGFSGIGLYECGSFGSPLIFLDVLTKVISSVNQIRVVEGFSPLQVECLFIFNDSDKVAIEGLKKNLAPFVAAIANQKYIFSDVIYLNKKFEVAYPEIKNHLHDTKYRNVFFNLDQCGYKTVSLDTIRDIMASWKSPEIILTFAVKTILTFISTDSEKSNVHLDPNLIKEAKRIIEDNDGIISKKQWLGQVERLVFEALKRCALYVSPFSINNPQGWQYWLMHFANNPRARQAYNNVLHSDGVEQAHFGRSGLKMLSYNPVSEGQLYLFNQSSREQAKKELHEDIPNFISSYGDMLPVADFYQAIYSETPAHSDDIHEMIIENPDIEVITKAGGQRRVANAIDVTDSIKLKPQKLMFFMYEPQGRK